MKKEIRPLLVAVLVLVAFLVWQVWGGYQEEVRVEERERIERIRESSPYPVPFPYPVVSVLVVRKPPKTVTRTVYVTVVSASPFCADQTVCPTVTPTTPMVPTPDCEILPPPVCPGSPMSAALFLALPAMLLGSALLRYQHGKGNR